MGDFPFIDVPIVGGGLTIGLVALVHVVLAHYAVGAGFMLYALEQADPEAKNGGIQRMLDLVGFSVIYVNFVVGAITGVGIWFTISIFSPDATQHLIQKFVWLWAAEWCCFAVEISVGYLYYYRRRQLDGRRRRQLALIYLIATWGSLLIITGILSYMLTSRDGNALVSWLNASALPSVLLRTLSSLALACLVILGLTTIRRWFPYGRESSAKQAVFRVAYRVLAWFFLLLPVAIWYRLSIPPTAASFAEGSSVPMSMFLGLTVFFSAVVTVVSWYAYRHVRILQAEAAALLLTMGIAVTFAAEFVREGIRKPYVIAPLLYSNGLWAADVANGEWQRQAELAGSVLLVRDLYPGDPRAKEAGRWQLPDPDRYDSLTPEQRGEYLFRAQCMICHTRHGFNALIHLTRCWDDDTYAAQVVRKLNVSKPFMPPFVGTDNDVRGLVRFVQQLRREHPPKPGGQPPDAD